MDLKTWLKANWLVSGFVAVSFVFVVFSIFMGSIERTEMKDAIETLTVKDRSLDKEIQTLASQDSKETVTRLNEDGINAREIGKTIVRVQNELAKIYRDSSGIGDRTESDALYDELSTVITDVSTGSMSDIWKGNTDWILELKTVVNYRKTDKVPVVFTMVDRAGDLMGVVRGNYDSVTNRMTDVSVAYTTKGEADIAIVTRG